MKRDIADKWIADLLSNPPQTTGCLFDGKGYCCMGRLGVVLGFLPVDYGDGHFYQDGADELLSNTMMKLAGMQSKDGTFDPSFTQPEEYQPQLNTLTELNDSHLTFAQIADVIDYFCDDL